jgi:anti-anti-sigma factor
MSGGFVIDLTTDDGYIVVSLTGELDLAESPGLRKSLEQLVQAGTQLIVVDASELTFLDSSGIGVLVASHNQQEALGGMFVIANLSETAGRPVRLTEVDTAIPVHWAEPALQPWTDEGASPASILEALGFAAEALVAADALDVDAEPIG